MTIKKGLSIFGLLLLCFITILLSFRFTFIGPWVFGYGEWENNEDALFNRSYDFNIHNIGNFWFSKVPCVLIGGEVTELIDDVPCSDNTNTTCVYISRACMSK